MRFPAVSDSAPHRLIAALMGFAALNPSYEGLTLDWLNHRNTIGAFIPGSGRRRGLDTPKGRQVDPAALDEVQALLGERERRRDLLIEHLHLLQDQFGCLHARHLVALAEEMRLALAEVYEVASFYAHFDIVMDDEAAPPRDHRAGVRQPDLRAGRRASSCSTNCATGSATASGWCGRRAWAAATRRRRWRSAMPCTRTPRVDSVAAAVGRRRDPSACPGLSRARRIPRRRRLSAAAGLPRRRHARSRQVIEALEDSGLRGLGGAGFPTGRKWRFVRQEPAPRLMAVNGDEGEPGTFKDRYFLETDPHRFLEGMLIAAWAVEAEEVYIYLRDEYPQCREILEREIAAVEAAGLAPHTRIHLRRGAGAYICGEESAMLESIEGRRGLPRHKPPFPSQVGLFGRPTLINNIETLFWVRDIVEKGPEWFTGQGRNGRQGLRTFSVSGRVKEPGVKLAPAGITARQLIDEFCGGMADGHDFKGYLPGGASGGILPASKADIPLDFGTLEARRLLYRLGARSSCSPTGTT